MAVLVLHFDNFKSLSKNKRIYYYLGDNFYDFYFLSDGFIVKSTLEKSKVDNEERFFADAMFYGSMELIFRIPDPEENFLENVSSIKVPLEAPETVVDEARDIEADLDNIQREGVDEDDVY